jgi:transposase
MSMRKPYPSDLTDKQWELAEPVITAWKARHPSVSGHEGKYAMREIVNAILYQNRTGCQWEFLPHDMPPPGAVKYYFYLWRDEGTDQDVHDLLRRQLREKRKRLADPSLVVLDTQRPGRREEGAGQEEMPGFSACSLTSALATHANLRIQIKGVAWVACCSVRSRPW